MIQRDSRSTKSSSHQFRTCQGSQRLGLKLTSGDTWWVWPHSVGAMCQKIRRSTSHFAAPTFQNRPRDSHHIIYAYNYSAGHALRMSASTIVTLICPPQITLMKQLQKGLTRHKINTKGYILGKDLPPGWTQWRKQDLGPDYQSPGATAGSSTKRLQSYANGTEALKRTTTNFDPATIQGAVRGDVNFVQRLGASRCNRP